MLYMLYDDLISKINKYITKIPINYIDFNDIKNIDKPNINTKILKKLHLSNEDIWFSYEKYDLIFLHTGDYIFYLIHKNAVLYEFNNYYCIFNRYKSNIYIDNFNEFIEKSYNTYKYYIYFKINRRIKITDYFMYLKYSIEYNNCLNDVSIHKNYINNHYIQYFKLLNNNLHELEIYYINNYCIYFI